MNDPADMPANQAGAEVKEGGAGASKFSNWLSSQSRSAARQRGSVGVAPAEYVVTREDGATIKLAKFEGGDLPTAIYRVANVPKGNALAATHAVCDCPAGSHGRQCKHLAIVEEWVRQNERG